MLIDLADWIKWDSVFPAFYLFLYSIDLSYDDPRPELIREASDALDKSFELTLEGLSDEEKDQAREIRINEKQEENALNGIGTEPDWKDSPLETIWWRDVDDLRDFEKEMYDMG